ncbi:MAG: thiolase domain-containing protein [Thaumarchaeota archaeon]|jgi:acetyl-CoA C-acetyltransferase|nr:thiolase domain-containing protein [Candidatus Geocrenenecus arthurdayi]MCL7389920.1 thiolase domain-containing protein [Candidatus Geocrenenecus arthurdayi]MCL7390762.1 thiolase domain-containing protein [Candidatus Geocrenenecus arthurdayi]MCL7396499.1 thiolase domain-containing protein [Candidatus Geocrenenecus arthurdayi]MCL7401571.1 thiolase domain-containing protein [Candidatus Geocrenenecus arthurdayi]
MRKVAIVGVGHSKFGERQDVNVRELAFESVKTALEEAGLTPRDIPYVSVGSIGVWYEEPLPAVAIAEYCGLTGSSLIRVEAACATGSAAVYSAYTAVASGYFDTALVIGVEKMREVDTFTAVELMGRAGSYLWEFENFGLTFPGYYALYATAYMNRFGASEEDLALVAVKNHRYGAMNPLAHIQREITVEDVLSSYVVAWPLKLYDCCPITDGSAAVVLASEEKVKELKVDTPVWIAGIGSSSGTGTLSYRSDFIGLDAAVKASRIAYKIAGVEPRDIDVAEVHDCFTIAELMAYEDLGFCGRGEGFKMIREGQTEVGGKIPVNIDGGLKAKGHPIGATGVSMMVELTKQLREEVKPSSRQAPMKNYVALAHNVGGTGHYCYVTILRR